MKDEYNNEMLLKTIVGKKDEYFDRISLIRAANREESLSPVREHTYKFTDPNLLKVITAIRESNLKQIEA